MTTETTQRWCHACSKHQDFDRGWYALRISHENECIIGRVSEREYFTERWIWLDEIYACGQTPALVLVERYLHTGTFNPPAPAEPTAKPDQFEALT